MHLHHKLIHLHLHHTVELEPKIINKVSDEVEVGKRDGDNLDGLAGRITYRGTGIDGEQELGSTIEVVERARLPLVSKRLGWQLHSDVVQASIFAWVDLYQFSALLLSVTYFSLVSTLWFPNRDDLLDQSR